MGGPVWGSPIEGANLADCSGGGSGKWIDELDNFHQCSVQYKGEMWISSEAAFQAAKFDPAIPAQAEAREAIRRSSGGQDCFLAGQSRVGIRKDWEAVKVQIMYEVNKVGKGMGAVPRT